MIQPEKSKEPAPGEVVTAPVDGAVEGEVGAGAEVGEGSGIARRRF